MKKLFLLALFAVITLLSSQAQEEKYIGLFVYNFTKHFDWPAEAKSGEFRIQVIGHKSVGDELKSLTAGKSVGHQRIVVEQIELPSQINPNTHILFLGHWQTRHLETVKANISGKSILLVTEFEGLIQKGAMINFVIREGKIKFELNYVNANTAGLTIDQRLKELAYQVIE